MNAREQKENNKSENEFKDLFYNKTEKNTVIKTNLKENANLMEDQYQSIYKTRLPKN